MSATGNPPEPPVTPRGPERPGRRSPFRDRWVLACTVIALASMIAAFVAFGLAARSRDEARAAAARPAGAGDANGAGSGGQDAEINPSGRPAAGWKARDPNLAPAGPGTVHAVTWPIEDRQIQVAPGLKQLMWTFDGSVPGPILHGHIGDTFEVTIVNHTQMGHSIDFHASQSAMNTDMRTIGPGQSLTYRFTAKHAGIWLYHCGTDPVLLHVGNGMYGAVVIDPSNLPPVDHTYALVQSELYLGPPGQTGDYAKMLAGDDDAVVFNNYYDQYTYAPLEVEAGDRIRIWVLDAGPNEISSFHVIGNQFDTVYKEGAYLLQAGRDGGGGSQTLSLAPAQGGFVEFTIPEKGKYSFLSHKLNDADRGALGTIMAH